MPACLLRCFRRVWLSATPWTGAPLGSFIHGTFQARIWEWVAMPSLPDPRIEPCLLHCRWILYCWATGEVQNYHRIQQSHFRVFLQRTEIRKNCFIPMCIVVLVTIAKRQKHQEMKKNSDMYSSWSIIHLQKWSSDTWFNKIHVCIKP